MGYVMNIDGLYVTSRDRYWW